MSKHHQTFIESFDPRRLDATFYADPYPSYQILRESSPVHRCPDGSYFFTRHADLNRIYRDPKTFSSAKETQFAPLFGDSPLFEHHTTSLVFNDPPLHTNVRKAIGDALAPRIVAGMESDLNALVARLLEGLADRPRFDLMEDYASVIPIEVIGNLLDIDRSERAPLRAWSAAILGALEFALDQDRLDDGNRAVVEFVEFLTDLIARRRNKLDGDDIVSRLLRFESAGFRLSEAEVYHQCIFLLNAGHETTTNLIGNAVHALCQNPRQRALLLANPALIDSAVEEFLRFEAPVQLGNRLTTKAVVFDDVEIPAGVNLTLSIGAANRDPTVFVEPDTLDIRRSPNPHLSFAGGIHACAGMAVARLEAKIAIEALFKTWPDLALDGEPQRAQRARFRGFTALPVRTS